METIDIKTTEPLWLEKSDVSGRRALRVDKRCDVCIVGAGITGVSLAYMLVKQGKSVILLDDGPIGAGDTCRTTAHICSQFDKPYHSLIELHGKRNAELALQSQVLAMHLIEELIAEQRIECDFKRVPAYLIPSPGQGTAELRKELKACQAIGLVSARLIDSIDLPFKQPRPAILFSNQARFNPVKYLNALLRAVERMGGRVYGNTHVDSVSDDSPASVHLST